MKAGWTVARAGRCSRPHRAAQRSPCAAVLASTPARRRSSASTPLAAAKRARAWTAPAPAERARPLSGDQVTHFATRARARLSRTRAPTTSTPGSGLRHAPDDDSCWKSFSPKKALRRETARTAARRGAHAAEVTRRLAPQSACASGPGSTYVWKPTDTFLRTDGAKRTRGRRPRISQVAVRSRGYRCSLHERDCPH